MLIALIACYPLLAILGLFMIIPIGPYVSEHAAFQNLDIARPDHYVRALMKVYSAWFQAKGKLSKKDL